MDEEKFVIPLEESFDCLSGIKAFKDKRTAAILVLEAELNESCSRGQRSSCRTLGPAGECAL